VPIVRPRAPRAIRKYRPPRRECVARNGVGDSPDCADRNAGIVPAIRRDRDRTCDPYDVNTPHSTKNVANHGTWRQQNAVRGPSLSKAYGHLLPTYSQLRSGTSSIDSLPCSWFVAIPSMRTMIVPVLWRKCHALGVAASNESHRQKCLEIEEMWRGLARKRLLWLTEDNLPVAL
jgi:hypothetical protein